MANFPNEYLYNVLTNVCTKASYEIAFVWPLSESFSVDDHSSCENTHKHRLMA